MIGVPPAAPRHWPQPAEPERPPAIPAPRRPAAHDGPADRREDVRVAAIVAGLMLFTALAATPFAPTATPQVPVSIAR